MTVTQESVGGVRICHWNASENIGCQKLDRVLDEKKRGSLHLPRNQSRNVAVLPGRKDQHHRSIS